ncbi:MAG: imm11 family protein [Pyrinomonadaceae bacterium]
MLGDQIGGKFDAVALEGYEDLPLGDFPLMALHVPVFSERAVALLQPVLIENGELLPLSCNEGSYFAYNVTTVLDALDVEKSSVIRFTDGGIIDITRHEFFPTKVTSLIFKIPQMPRMDVFVTDEFQEAVSRHDLKGFDFKLVWKSTS